MERQDLSDKERKVLKSIESVTDPEFGKSIGSRQLIDEVKVEGETASIVFHLTVPFCPDVFALHIGREIMGKAKEVDGVEKVNIRVKDHRNAEKLTQKLMEESDD
ncbi:MAG: iron-sulfur cluster assembly protein [bacterium]